MMMNSVATAIVVGTLVGTWGMYFAIGRLIASDWMLQAGRPPTAFGRRVVWAVAVIAVPFAWFMGFVVGGNFGGAFAGVLAERTGLPEAALIPAGIGLGLAMCIALICTASAFIALTLVRLVERNRGAGVGA